MDTQPFRTSNRGHTRRRFLELAGSALAAGSVVGVAAACGPAAVPPAPTAPARTAPPAPTAPPANQTVPATKRPLDVVQRGDLKGITFGAAIARARGYFEEAGIDDQVTVFKSGAEQSQALAGGQLEIANSSNGSAQFNAIAQGFRQPFVCDNWHLEAHDNAYMVVVRPDLAERIKSVGELRGLVNATSTTQNNGGSYFQADKMFRAAGLQLSDVNWETLPFPDMLAALGTQKVDAAWMIEPFIALGEKQSVLVRKFNLGDFDPGFQIAGLTYSEKLIQNRPDVARRWMLANIRGIRDYNDFIKGKNREVIGPILASHTGLTPDMLDGTGWMPLHPDGRLNTDSIVKAQQLLQEWGGIKQPLPIEQIVDQQFLNYAVQQLGPYRG